MSDTCRPRSPGADNLCLTHGRHWTYCVDAATAEAGRLRAALGVERKRTHWHWHKIAQWQGERAERLHALFVARCPWHDAPLDDDGLHHFPDGKGIAACALTADERAALTPALPPSQPPSGPGA